MGHIWLSMRACLTSCILVALFESRLHQRDAHPPLPQRLSRDPPSALRTVSSRNCIQIHPLFPQPLGLHPWVIQDLVNLAHDTRLERTVVPDHVVRRQHRPPFAHAHGEDREEVRCARPSLRVVHDAGAKTREKAGDPLCAVGEMDARVHVGGKFGHFRQRVLEGENATRMYRRGRSEGGVGRLP